MKFSTIQVRNSHYFRAKESREEDDIVRDTAEKPAEKPAKKRVKRAKELSLADPVSGANEAEQQE